MPTVQERQRNRDRNPDVQIPEQQNLEAPEYNEAGLRELVGRATMEVQSAESRVASLDARVEQAAVSVGIDQQRAAAIFSERGFTERIKNIKDRIFALTKNTRERVIALAALSPTRSRHSRESCRVRYAGRGHHHLD